MVTEPIWRAFSKKEKEDKIVECLTQIEEIELGKHRLSGTRQSGALCHVKSDLEKFILNAISWETK